jgi:hypothetical protein
MECVGVVERIIITDASRILNDVIESSAFCKGFRMGSSLAVVIVSPAAAVGMP